MQIHVCCPGPPRDQRVAAQRGKPDAPIRLWLRARRLSYPPASFACRTAAAETSCFAVTATIVDQQGVEARPVVLMARMNVTYWTCVGKQHVIVSKSRGGHLVWRRCGACSGRGGGVDALTRGPSSSVTTGSLAPLRARAGSLGLRSAWKGCRCWHFGARNR